MSGIVHTRAAWSMKEAAALLGVSRSHLYALADRDGLRLVRIGRRTVVPASEIDRLLAADPEADEPGNAGREEETG